MHVLVSSKRSLWRLIGRSSCSYSKLCGEVKRSRASCSALAVAFSVGPIRGEISRQIAAAPSVSGAVLWFDPMKLAWNNRAEPSTLPLSAICQFSVLLSFFVFPPFLSLSAVCRLLTFTCTCHFSATSLHFSICKSPFFFCNLIFLALPLSPPLPPNTTSSTTEDGG